MPHGLMVQSGSLESEVATTLTIHSCPWSDVGMTSLQAPGRSEDVKAVWSWAQMQLASGLLEYWGASESEPPAQVHS